MTLKDKVILITGSSIGIGKETAFKFSQEGAKVIITYHSHEDSAKEVADKCKTLGASEVMVVELDVKDDDSIRSAVKLVIEKFDKIDVLVNNAGVIYWKEFKEQTFDEIEDQVRTNVEGLIKMTKECIPHVKETIINLSSGAGKRPIPSLSTYCGTKYAVRGFTQVLSQEFPEINFFSVNPDMTATQMTDFKGRPPEVVAEIILKAAKGEYEVGEDRDIDVWDKAEEL